MTTGLIYAIDVYITPKIESNIEEAMINFDLLIKRSCMSGIKFLKESGYKELAIQQFDSTVCDAEFLYPYVLFNDNSEVIDILCQHELCNLEDGEYEDYENKWCRLCVKSYNPITSSIHTDFKVLRRES